MTGFIILTALSAVLLFGFILLGVFKFGLLRSYSSYAARWDKAVPMDNANLWSLVTFAAAALLVPVMIELGTLSALQFLGFLTPLYLMAVSLTPKWASDPTQHKFHVWFAGFCALGGILWTILVAHTLPVLIGALAIVAIVSALTKTVKSSTVFWLEMVMFLTVYCSIFILIL